MTELAEQSELVDALPLGPDSLVWKYFGDNRMYLIGPRPAVLQNMLAELGQGVLKVMEEIHQELHPDLKELGGYLMVDKAD